jgi:branched-chain amino acid transport system permease protein
VPVYHIAGGSFTQTHVIIFAAALLAYVGLALLLSRTVFGKAIQALSDDQEVATIIGIHTGRFIGYVFFIGSALAGAAGVALGFDTGIQPTLGLPLLLKGVIASIVGGVGSIHGAVLGAVVLGFVENFGIWKIPGEWKDALAFGLLIVFLIFRPRGILGR